MYAWPGPNVCDTFMEPILAWPSTENQMPTESADALPVFQVAALSRVMARSPWRVSGRSQDVSVASESDRGITRPAHPAG